MYKLIFVSIDGSQAAKLVLEEALKIAEAAMATPGDARALFGRERDMDEIPSHL